MVPKCLTDLISLHVFNSQSLSLFVSLVPVPQLAGSQPVWSGQMQLLFLRGGSPRHRSSGAEDVSYQAIPGEKIQTSQEELTRKEQLEEIEIGRNKSIYCLLRTPNWQLERHFYSTRDNE